MPPNKPHLSFVSREQELRITVVRKLKRTKLCFKVLNGHNFCCTHISIFILEGLCRPRIAANDLFFNRYPSETVYIRVLWHQQPIIDNTFTADIHMYAISFFLFLQFPSCFGFFFNCCFQFLLQIRWNRIVFGVSQDYFFSRFLMNHSSLPGDHKNVWIWINLQSSH